MFINQCFCQQNNLKSRFILCQQNNLKLRLIIWVKNKICSESMVPDKLDRGKHKSHFLFLFIL